jgi:hypothetical protein
VHRPATVVAAACLLGAQGIHTAVLRDHWVHSRPQGGFFLALGLLEGGLAAGLLVAPSRRLGALVVSASVATVAVWAWTRTVGVPLGAGAGAPEPVGRADAVATLLELVTAVAAVPLARGMGAWESRARWSPTIPVAVGVALFTAFGLAGADDHRHGAGQGAHGARAPADIAAPAR